MQPVKANCDDGTIARLKCFSFCRSGIRPAQLAAGFLIVLLLLSSFPQPSYAYSFLTHEDMVDVAWKGSIRPLLLARFPTATEAQLHIARAYAYGGATIQDMGYYPFGHQFFSNLTHYVRSGEFVDNLFLDAQTVNEYAFAIGALSHYIGDSYGHKWATNPSTPIEFPSLEKKFGPIVTYDQSPHGHVRTEFAYDVEQLSQHWFAPSGYMKGIGFNVPRRLLEQAFFDTYGLSLRSVLGRPGPAIGSYRSSVKGILPDIARAEVLIHRNDFPREVVTPAFYQFSTRQKQAGLDFQWARFKHKAGFKLHFIAFMIRILPKIGPISDAAIRGPNAETNRWYVESVNRSVDDYEQLLEQAAKSPRKTLDLPDRDLDTGNLVQPGAYRLTDKTYAQLLARLTADPHRKVPAGLQKNIIAYYSDPNAPITTKKNPQAWKRVQAELVTLRQMDNLHVGVPRRGVIR
ncbi:MAG: zinc dependent phospholipase C family protein [Acidobacteriaceae bacterium]